MRHWRGLSLLFLLTALIVALFCMLTALVANRPGAPMFPDTAVLWNEGWRSDNGTTPVLPCEIRPSQTKGRAILEKRLPETLPEDAVLVLRSNYLPVEAEVGGETLWVSGSFIQSGPFRLTYAGPASLVRLNAACAGQTLRLTFHPGGSKTRMELHEVVLGSAEGVLTHYMLKDEFITSFGWLLFALAMGMFLFSLILNKFNAREFFLGFFYTSLSLLLTSVWVLSDIGACAVRYGHHSIYLFINLFSYLLVPVPILLLLRNYITRGGRALDALAVLTLLLNVAVVMLCCLGINPNTTWKAENAAARRRWCAGVIPSTA